MEKTITKKQVSGVLKILKEGRKSRSALGDVYIQEYKGKNYATLSDGKCAVMIPTNATKTGIIPFIEIENWYKLAKAKDKLDFTIFEENLQDDRPILDIPGFFDNKIVAVETIALNSNILQTLQIILGADYVLIDFNGQYKPLFVSRPKSDIIALMMPLRI